MERVEFVSMFFIIWRGCARSAKGKDIRKQGRIQWALAGDFQNLWRERNWSPVNQPRICSKLFSITFSALFSRFLTK